MDNTTQTPSTKKTAMVLGAERPIILSLNDGWTALAAAGIKVVITDGKRRAYDPKPMHDGFVSLTWACLPSGAFPDCKYFGKVSGAFASKCRETIERAIAAARAAE